MRLRRADCSAPGLRRRRRGRGFSYLDERTGGVVRDRETLVRIRALAIPPAWRDVWICPLPNGHLQAVGTDRAGRRQYLYHQRWRERRDQEKFDHMLDFARALPKLRERVAADLGGGELTRERVLACAVRLLDRGFFRIGSETYAEHNGTYGLATMRKDQVSVDGESLVFDYPSKGGTRRVASLVDPEGRPPGRWPARGPRATAPSPAVKEVAHYLGNTPAVARRSYIDPRLFDRYLSGHTVAGGLDRVGQVGEIGVPAHQAIEQAALELISERRDEPPRIGLARPA